MHSAGGTPPQPAAQQHGPQPVKNNHVQLSINSASPQALGSVTADLHGSRLLALASCSTNSDKGASGRSGLRAPLDYAPTYSERASMPYRNVFSRKDLTNEREQYIEGFMEGIVSAVVPDNFPVDIKTHGTLLHCPALNTVHGGVAGFHPDRLPDAPVLYANALALALSLSNVLLAPFAAVRIALQQHQQREPARVIINPTPEQMQQASAQLLYIGTEHGPLSVVYDTARPAHGKALLELLSADALCDMLDIAHKSTCEGIKAQQEIVAASGYKRHEWPQLAPSSGAVRVLQEIMESDYDAFLRSEPCSRAEQELQLAALLVGPCLVRSCFGCAALEERQHTATTMVTCNKA